MKTRNTVLVCLNTFSFIIVLYVNYLAQTHALTNITIAEVSHKYDSLFSPADYAFLIWPVIYLMCAGFIVYQWTILKNDIYNYIQRTGIWFTAANLLNALWCYCWVHEWLGISVIIMLALLICLIILTVRLRLELDDEPVRIIFFVWWPITFYMGWIVAATVACIASYLVYINWDGFKISADVWTIIMIVVAFVVYLFLNQKRNMREAAGIGIWAFIAIAVRQWNEHLNIAITAIIVSAVLLALSVWHGYNNRFYSPFNKIKRGGW